MGDTAAGGPGAGRLSGSEHSNVSPRAPFAPGPARGASVKGDAFPDPFPLLVGMHAGALTPVPGLGTNAPCLLAPWQTVSPHKESAGPGVPPCPLGDVESLEAAWTQREPLDPSSSARAVLLVSPLGCGVGGTPGRAYPNRPPCLPGRAGAGGAPREPASGGHAAGAGGAVGGPAEEAPGEWRRAAGNR